MARYVGTEGFFGWVTTLVHANRTRLTRVVRREGVRYEDALDCVQDHGSGKGSAVSAAQLREIGRRFSESLGCRPAAAAIGSVADSAIGAKHLGPVGGRNLNRLSIGY